jgi:AbrB family looped-hinge helix DNA binding protein
MGPHGRVVIPANVRRQLGLTEGSILVAVLEDDGHLILETRQDIAQRLRGPLRDPAAGRDLSAELRAERQAEAALEKAKASGDEWAITRARKAIADVGRHKQGSAGGDVSATTRPDVPLSPARRRRKRQMTDLLTRSGQIRHGTGLMGEVVRSAGGRAS